MNSITSVPVAFNTVSRPRATTSIDELVLNAKQSGFEMGVLMVIFCIFVFTTVVILTISIPRRFILFCYALRHAGMMAATTAPWPGIARAGDGSEDVELGEMRGRTLRRD